MSKDNAPLLVICSTDLVPACNAGLVVAPIVKVTVSSSVTVTFPISVIFSSTVNVDEDVNTGDVVSVTLTVLVAVPSFPEASVDVYVNVYSPTVSVSTVPEVTTSTVPDASVAVAPASV